MSFGHRVVVVYFAKKQQLTYLIENASKGLVFL
jgi:hypothetical protein